MEIGKGTITRRLDAVLDGLQDEFRSLYDRSDFENKLVALKKAGNGSDRASLLRQLFDMFDVCGIKYERGRDNAYYEQIVRESAIPSFAEMEDRMLYALYVRYSEYPSPEDYMRRMVDRLSSAEDHWQGSLRLRILKQFIKYGNYLTDAGYGGRKAISDYVRAGLGRKPVEVEILERLDDGVFDILEMATRAQKKPEGKYGLLKMTDDLAMGGFHAEGATRRSLYLFAMVYKMTYCCTGREPDVRTDIEVNLFRDFYTNNLMRYVSGHFRNRLCEYEQDPSGQGINYKNFAEMIYLYYISKDIAPQEKIRLASEMIRRVQDRRFKKGKADAVEHRDETVYYRGLLRHHVPADYYSEDILSLPETAFEEFICSHYTCDTYAGSYEVSGRTFDSRTGALQLETEQISAYREYLCILDDLKSTGASPEDCRYGLWFTDVAAIGQRGLDNICDRRVDIDRDRFHAFVQLLQEINSLMCSRAFNVTEETVTRTTLIVAYYYYYNALHEDDEKEQWKSFEEVFGNFKQGIDARLERAYYQPLSGKNIFDVLVTFSSYAYLNV